MEFASIQLKIKIFYLNLNNLQEFIIKKKFLKGSSLLFKYYQGFLPLKFSRLKNNDVEYEQLR